MNTKSTSTSRLTFEQAGEMGLTCSKRCCQHPNVLPILELTPHIKHYGKWKCAVKGCGKFLTWAKNPSTSLDMKYRQDMIVDYLVDMTMFPDDNNGHEQVRTLCTLFNKAHLGLVDQCKWKELFDDLPFQKEQKKKRRLRMLVRKNNT